MPELNNNELMKRITFAVGILAFIGGFVQFIYPHLFLSQDEVAWVRNAKQNGISLSEDVRWREQITLQVKALQTEVEKVNTKLDKLHDAGIHTREERKQLIVDVLRELKKQE